MMKTLRHAIRSLKHFWLFSAINIFGLAISLVCVMVIAHYVYTEITVDHFHKNHKRLFITTAEAEIRQGTLYPAHFEMLPDLVINDPAIERMGMFFALKEQIEVDDQYYEISTLRVDSVFLQMMDYPILHGENNIRKPESALISKSFAKKIFGNDDPLGKTCTHSRGNSFTITGIVDKLPGKSGFEFDLILPFNDRLPSARGHVLIELFANYDHQSFNKKHLDFIPNEAHRQSYRYALFPFDQLYFRTQQLFPEYFRYQTGNRNGVTILSIVGLLILLIGLTNFINICTVVVLHRGREFGMKKVFGANGKNIFLPLWTENVLMVGLALLVALLLREIFSPLIRQILHFDQMPFRLFDLLLVVGLWGVVPLLVSVFPFLNYSYRKPITSLQSVGKTGGKPIVQKIVLVFQYMVTFVMIIVSLLFIKQFRFITQKDLGFRTKDVIQFSITDDVIQKIRQGGGDIDRGVGHLIELLEQKIDESPLFTHRTTARSPITTEVTQLTDLHLPGETTPEVSFMEVDKDWFDIFELKLVTGALWDKGGVPFRLYGDIDSPMMNTNLIFTESALKAFSLNLSNYADVSLENGQFTTAMRIVGRMSSGGTLVDRTFGNLHILGVVEDIYTDHLSKSLSPLVFVQVYGMGESFHKSLTVSIVSGQRQEAIKYLHQIYDEIVGGHFTFTFLEDEIRAMYDEERKITTIYSIFTAIAILISVMGLFSISLFDIQQRRREVAIRKVNGATTGIILGMLIKRYLTLLGIAFVFAAPLGWLAIRHYLAGFAYKTVVSWWIFAVALLVTVGISLLTLIWQTQKAATANPAGVIRNE